MFQYEGESVNRLQMGIKRKTCDIRTRGGKHLLLDMPSANTDTLVPSLCLCVGTRSIEMFWLLPQPLRTPISTSSSSTKRLPPSCEPIYATNTSHRKEETLLYEYPFNWVLLPTRSAQQNVALRYYTPQAWSPFWLLKPASEHTHARLLPRLLWDWTVLLPSDTHTITSITTVLLSFVTYLLNLLVV
jgi:hypothetical protein